MNKKQNNKDECAEELSERYTEEQIASMIRLHLIEQYGSVYKASKEIGVSDSHLSAVFNNKKKPTERLLGFIGGYEHKEVYYTIG